MQREPVVSTNIAEVGYDSQFATLEIMFSNGKVYQYFDVPQSVYEEMLTSESIGRFFSINVRGVFRFAQV